jgi:hypothetical protein
MPSPADEASLGFRDQIGEICAVYAGVLAEWHHVWTGVRPPSLHNRLPPQLAPTVAIGSIIQVDEAVAAGRLSAARGQIARVSLYAAMGEEDLAQTAINTVLHHLERGEEPDADEHRDLLLELKRTLHDSGASANGHAWGRLEALSERESLRRLGRAGGCQV